MNDARHDPEAPRTYPYSREGLTLGNRPPGEAARYDTRTSTQHEADDIAALRQSINGAIENLGAMQAQIDKRRVADAERLGRRIDALQAEILRLVDIMQAMRLERDE